MKRATSQSSVVFGHSTPNRATAATSTITAMTSGIAAEAVDPCSTFFTNPDTTSA